MTTTAAIALHRFGLGSRPGEAHQIARDPRGWLLEQLDGQDDFVLLDSLPAPLSSVPELEGDSHDRDALRRHSGENTHNAQQT